MAPERLVVEAPAKLNLFLRVLAREADGYHGIETLFCRIDLSDRLELVRTEAAGVSLRVTGADTGPADDNLAVRAARMVLGATGEPFGVAIDLTKRIPVKAGLGGGSSDAAAALVGVNRLAGNPVPRHELLQFAARLGSDVPFFVSEAPLALAWGHGERLLRLSPLAPRPGLLIIPPATIATPEAYGWVDEGRGGARRGSVAMTTDTLGGWSDVARLAGNDFEAPVFARHPEVRQAFEALAGTGPQLCRMSGSGAAVFAVYRDSPTRDEARSVVATRHGRTAAFATG